jgi:hypothetical protein
MFTYTTQCCNSFFFILSALAQMSRASSKRSLNTLLTARFESSPKPLNCTTFSSTHFMVQDERHPLHIHTLRRIDAWNPKRLHWAVRVPVAISKKRTVRSWLTRRFRDAIVDELQKSGFNKWGEPVAPSLAQSPLTGALSINILRPALTASIEDVRHACRFVLRKHAFGRLRP